MKLAHVVISAKIEVVEAAEKGETTKGMKLFSVNPVHVSPAFLQAEMKAYWMGKKSLEELAIAQGNLLDSFAYFMSTIEQATTVAVGGPEEMAKIDGIVIDSLDRGRFITVKKR
ncbi:hypothetical protein L6252_03120 [Candidatus Parcubacteria bacterium]|nr:hypothetical protein [Candidatus Parcubacteria bacterium]